MEIYPSQHVTRSPPKTLDADVHWKFKQRMERQLPAAFVAVVPNGRVWGSDGNVIAPDNKLLPELCKEVSKGCEYLTPINQLPIFAKKRLAPAYKIDGTVAVLSAPAGRGYYHWIFDVLPRIHLLRKSGIDLNSIDKFLVNNYVSRFHLETLPSFGIPKHKIIESHWYPHIQAERLVVPSLPGDTGHVPGWVCGFLRHEFLPEAARGRMPERIYVSRSQVTHRRVTNEDEVVNLLSKCGFQPVTLEAMSVAEQVSLFASAKVIVAAHGAGLTDIVFCNPASKIIEFHSPNGVNAMYWQICNQMNLDYYYLIGEGERPPENFDPGLHDEDIKINLDSLKTLIKLAHLENGF